MQTLDAEIAIYRKMLEGEENRAGLRQLVEQVVKTTSLSHSEENGETFRGRSLENDSSSLVIYFIDWLSFREPENSEG